MHFQNNTVAGGGVSILELRVSHENNYFTNYVDGVTPHVTGNNLEEVASELKFIAQILFTWFAQKELKGNPSKCHTILSTTKAFNFQITETVRK